MMPNKKALIEWASYIALALLITEILYTKLRDLIMIIWKDYQNIPSGIRQNLVWLVLAGCVGAAACAFFLGGGGGGEKGGEKGE